MKTLEPTALLSLSPSRGAFHHDEPLFVRSFERRVKDEGRGVTAPGSIVPLEEKQAGRLVWPRGGGSSTRRKEPEEIVGEVGVEEGERGPCAAGSDVWRRERGGPPPFGVS